MRRIKTGDLSLFRFHVAAFGLGLAAIATRSDYVRDRISSQPDLPWTLLTLAAVLFMAWVVGFLLLIVVLYLAMWVLPVRPGPP